MPSARGRRIYPLPLALCKMSPLGISCILFCGNIAWKNWNPGRCQPRHSYAPIYSAISYQFPSVQLYNQPAGRKAVLLWLLLSFFFLLRSFNIFFVIILFTWLVYIFSVLETVNESVSYRPLLFVPNSCLQSILDERILDSSLLLSPSFLQTLHSIYLLELCHR